MDERKISILILEDSPEDAELMGRELSSCGFVFASNRVANQDAFNKALDGNSYDLILADYKLPGFSGMDALILSKKKHAKTPFILVSGAVGEELATEMMRLGADDYVCKDKLSGLGAAVLNAIEKKRKERKLTAANKALAESEARYRLLFESAHDVMVQIDRTGKIVDINEHALRRYGYLVNQFIGKDISSLGMFFSSSSVTRMAEKFTRRMLGKEVDPYEVSAATNDGKKVIFEVNAMKLEDTGGGNLGEFAILHDITEHKRMEEMLRSISMKDDLTGLYNRRGFLMLAGQHLKVAKRSGHGALLVFVDVDDMKWINDSLGHLAGDQALQDVAGILKSTFRESDVLARIGGDEFVVLAIEAPHENSNSVISRLNENLDEFNVDFADDFGLSLSMGSTRYDPANPISIEELLARADEQMYETKSGKKKLRNRVGQ